MTGYICRACRPKIRRPLHPPRPRVPRATFVSLTSIPPKQPTRNGKDGGPQETHSDEATNQSSSYSDLSPASVVPDVFESIRNGRRMGRYSQYQRSSYQRSEVKYDQPRSSLRSQIRHQDLGSQDIEHESSFATRQHRPSPRSKMPRSRSPHPTHFQNRPTPREEPRHHFEIPSQSPESPEFTYTSRPIPQPDSHPAPRPRVHSSSADQHRPSSYPEVSTAPRAQTYPLPDPKLHTSQLQSDFSLQQNSSRLGFQRQEPELEQEIKSSNNELHRHQHSSSHDAVSQRIGSHTHSFVVPPLPPFSQTATNRAESSKIEEESPFTKLKSLMEKEDVPFTDIWDYFRVNFGSPDSPALKHTSFKDLSAKFHGDLFRSLLIRAVAAWCKDPASGRIPDPLDVLAELDAIPAGNDWNWGRALWELAFQANASIRADDNRKAQLVSKLVELWRRTLFRYNSKPIKKEVPDGWSCLPDVQQYSKQLLGTANLLKRLNVLMPKYPLVRFRHQMVAAFMLSFNILWVKRRALNLSDSEIKNYMPFVTILAHTIRLSDFAERTDGLALLLRRQLVDDKDVVEIRDEIKKSIVHVNAVVAQSADSRDSTLEVDKLTAYFLKRLARAVETQNVATIDKMWAEVKETFEQVGQGTSGDPVPGRVYDAFLHSYMNYHSAERTIALWNEMVQRGTQPTNASWTALLNGARKKGLEDAAVIEDLWKRMLASGIYPDSYNWNSRIYGLMSCKQFRAGFKALQEMGLIWERALQLHHKKKLDPDSPLVRTPKPDSATINAALTVIARSAGQSAKGREYIGRILEWGKRYQIQPNHFTFNILIGMEMRNGDYDKAVGLLGQMEASNIKPDIATFAIFIHSLMQNTWSRNLPKGELLAKIMNILKDLEKHNLRPNAYIYSTIIDGLLKHDNLEAAHSILTHMEKIEVRTPAPVWTSLATYYFSQNPPNISAVDALWTRVIQPGAIRDHLLFDRLIDGYGRNGEIGKMMTVLMRMCKEGKRPYWRNLITVVRGLVDAGDYARAREMVEDVKSGTGELVAGVRGTANSQEMFWRIVQQLGLGSADDSPRDPSRQFEVIPPELLAEEEDELSLDDKEDDLWADGDSTTSNQEDGQQWKGPTPYDDGLEAFRQSNASPNSGDGAFW